MARPNKSDDVMNFKREAMWVQMGRIEDSAELKDVVDEKKYRPITSVITDDGDMIEMTAEQVKAVKQVITSVPTQARASVIESIQTTRGLTAVLKVAVNFELV
jgi:NDP-sugar pyrophosphorylase family protein